MWMARLLSIFLDHGTKNNCFRVPYLTATSYNIVTDNRDWKLEECCSTSGFISSSEEFLMCLWVFSKSKPKSKKLHIFHDFYIEIRLFYTDCNNFSYLRKYKRWSIIGVIVRERNWESLTHTHTHTTRFIQKSF